MAKEELIYLLFILGVFPTGLMSVIQTDQTVMAAVGEEAHLSCQLMVSKDVHQVTWQKVLPDEDKNMASNHKYLGQNVNQDFKNKVNIKDVGLQNSSIVLRNITEQDEGCYLCLFNTYPEGALTGTTCLQLCELHEPVLLVRASNSAEESVVSCSVTGRPAPTVTLTVTHQHLHLSHYNTSTVNNADATLTVTTTAVLSGFRGDQAQVGCAGRVLSGPHKEVFLMIPEVKHTSADEVDEEHESEHRHFRRTLVVLSVVVVCCVAVITVLFILKHKNRTRKPSATDHNTSVEEHGRPVDEQEKELSKQSSAEKMEESDVTISEEHRKPLVMQVNEVRKRTSPDKTEESNNTKSPSSSKRRLIFG